MTTKKIFLALALAGAIFTGCTNTPTPAGTENIKITSPLPEQTISSPLTIEGEARGLWYFEGSFTVSLVNWDGLIIAENQAYADGDWMTEDFVNFTTQLTFETPGPYKTGALIFQKANPSDLPENDEAYEMSIKFE